MIHLQYSLISIYHDHRLHSFIQLPVSICTMRMTSTTTNNSNKPLYIC